MDQGVLNALSKSALKSTRAANILVFSAVLFACSAGIFFLFNQELLGLLQSLIACGQLVAALVLPWKTKQLRSYTDRTAAQ